MKRSAPLRRVPLRAPTLEEVWRWRSKPRKPIPRQGRKAKREQAAWLACRAAVISRSRGQCEGNVANVCPAYPHGATQVHHLAPSDRDRGVHDPDRCRHLCTKGHDWVHAFPLEAEALGLLIRASS